MKSHPENHTQITPKITPKIISTGYLRIGGIFINLTLCSNRALTMLPINTETRKSFSLLGPQRSLYDSLEDERDHALYKKELQG